MNIKRTKTVHVAWTNTDLTEGKGYSYPLYVCESPETATRLGKGKSVQGSNCTVTPEVAVMLEGKYYWLIPGYVHPESKEDTQARKIREAEETKKEARIAAIERAKALGLSEEDVNILMEK